MTNNDWSIKITKAENGFIVKWKDDNNNWQQTIFEDDDEDSSGDNELISMFYVLKFVQDHFGEGYSKHNKKNIYMEIEEKKGED